METVINTVLMEMQSFLKPDQLRRLKAALKHALEPQRNENAQDLLVLFLTAKKVEGCFQKTLRYYEDTLTRALTTLNKPVPQIESGDLRQYLNDYESMRRTVCYWYGNQYVHSPSSSCKTSHESFQGYVCLKPPAV